MAQAQSILAQICVEKKRLNRSMNITVLDINNNQAKEKETVTENDATILLNSSDLISFSKSNMIKNNLDNSFDSFEDSNDENDDDHSEGFGRKFCNTNNQKIKARLQLSDSDN